MTGSDEGFQYVGRRHVPKIPEIIAAPRRCAICNDPRKTAYVNAQLYAGMSAVYIAGVLTNDMNLKTGTAAIISHKKHYIPVPPKTPAKPADLAILIRDATVARVQDGTLEPTIRDGLAAVAILDKRAAMTTDRNMFLMMARALAGNGPIGLLEPPSDLIIDGEAVEID